MLKQTIWLQLSSTGNQTRIAGPRSNELDGYPLNYRKCNNNNLSKTKYSEKYNLSNFFSYHTEIARLPHYNLKI